MEVFSQAAVEAASQRHVRVEEVEEPPSKKRLRSPSPSPGQRRQPARSEGLKKMVLAQKEEEGQGRQEYEGVTGRVVTAGNGICQGAAEERLLQEARKTLQVRRPPQPEDANGRRATRSLVRVRGRAFPAGEDCNWGQKLLAAIEFERPEGKALKGWRKMAPPQTRLPILILEFLKSSMSGILIYRGLQEMALYNKLTFSTYDRPGETLRVIAVDVAKANAESQHSVVILSPAERGVFEGGGLRRSAGHGRQALPLACDPDHGTGRQEAERSRGHRAPLELSQRRST